MMLWDRVCACDLYTQCDHSVQTQNLLYCEAPARHKSACETAICRLIVEDLEQGLKGNYKPVRTKYHYMLSGSTILQAQQL